MKDFYVEAQVKEKGMPVTIEVNVQSFNGKCRAADAHMHDKIEILYSLRGNFEACLNGVKYAFGEGDILIINSHEIHSIISMDEGINRYMVLKLEPDILYTSAQAIFEMKYVMSFTLEHSTHPKRISSEELSATEVPTLMEELLLEATEKKYGYELAVKACIFRLFLWMLRLWRTYGINLNINSDIKETTLLSLQKVFDYVDMNYYEKIAVIDMADICNMSYSYFSRTFKGVMNQSFNEYLNHVRISEAEKLLCKTDMNISEIAYETGFSDTGYFIQKFKALKGISPKKFQNMYLSKSEMGAKY